MKEQETEDVDYCEICGKNISDCDLEYVSGLRYHTWCLVESETKPNVNKLIEILLNKGVITQKEAEKVYEQ